MIRTLEKPAAMILRLFALGIVSLSVHAAEIDSLDSLELLELLHERQFQELEKRLSSVQARYESGQTNDGDLIRAFYPFANSDPAHEKLLTEWIRMMPDSYIPVAVRGIYYADVGWSMRSTDSARDTSAEQFAGMAKYHGLALADLQSAVARNPNFIIGYAEIISLSKGTGGRKVLRDQALTQALAIDPTSYAVRWAHLYGLMPRWGGSYEEIGRFIDDTRKYTAENPALNPLLGFADYVRARKYKERGDYHKAIDHYSKALEHGDSARYYKDRGIAYDYLDDHDNAFRDLNKAIELSPYYAEALYWRGTIYDELKMYDQALADLTLAARLEPYDSFTLKFLGDVLYEKGRYVEADKVYTDALYYEPNESGIWERKGRVLGYQLRKPEEAAEAYLKAATLSPHVPEYWHVYAKFMRLHDECELVPILRTYLKACESSPDQDCQYKDKHWAEWTIDHALTLRGCPDKDPYPIKRETPHVTVTGLDYEWSLWELYKSYVLALIWFVLEILNLPPPE